MILYSVIKRHFGDKKNKILAPHMILQVSTSQEKIHISKDSEILMKQWSL